MLAIKALEKINKKESAETFTRTATAFDGNVWVSTNMSGKLYGIPAISTACNLNPICIKRMNNGNAVCAHCFAAATMNQYQSCREHMQDNFYLLTSELIDATTAFKAAMTCKLTNDNIARIEAFGDVANVTQARNYIRIINAGNQFGLHFGVWTKNPGIWDVAIKLEGRPENATFILSSLKLNEIDLEIASRYDWIDCTFTVYDDKQKAAQAIKAGAVECKCDKESCNKLCRHCYSYRREPGADIQNIVELLRK